MRILTCILACMALSSCGIVKGASNPFADKAIKIANEITPQDSVPEEFVEDAIQTATGVELDISPATPEVK